VEGLRWFAVLMLEEGRTSLILVRAYGDTDAGKVVTTEEEGFSLEEKGGS